MQLSMLNKAFLVWRMADAPESLKALARPYDDGFFHRVEEGDQPNDFDWLVVMPSELPADPMWMWHVQTYDPTWCVVEDSQLTVARESLLDDKVIVVYGFYWSPAELQNIGNCGGDEDWLAVVPAAHNADDIGWLQSGSRFGCCDVSKRELADSDGSVLCTGCHA